MKLPWSSLKPAAKRGLLAHALHWQAVQIGQLYVAVYLFRVGHGYGLPALHALCSYLMVPVGYWGAAYLARAKGAGHGYRLGVGLYAAYQALILSLGPSAGAWAGWLGALWGLGVGSYWQSWVLLMFDLSDEGRDRDAMLAANQSVFFVASFTGAPLAGWFLARFSGTAGYPFAFGASLALFCAAWLVSLPLRARPQHGSGAVGRLLGVSKPAGWNAMLFSALLMGFLSVGTMFLPMLIAYEAGGNEGWGGNYAAFTALAGFGVTALMARAGDPAKRGGFVLRSGLAVTALILPLAFSRHYSLVLLYGLGMAVAGSAFNVPLFAAHIRIVEADRRFRHRRADAMFLREVPLNFGRVLACAIVLWGVKDLRSGALSALLVLLAAVPLLNFAALRPWLDGRGALPAGRGRGTMVPTEENP